MAEKTRRKQALPVSMEEILFARKKCNMNKLLPFGFARRDGGCAYTASIIDGQFLLTVFVSDAGAVSTRLAEAATGEEYVLHRIPDASGAFVGRIKEEYEAVLQIISEACFEPDVFKSDAAKQVIQYARDTYQDELEFLWKRFPDNAVLRRKDTGKWYAALLVLSREKLGLDSRERVDVLDLRVRPEEVGSTVDGVRFFPGYHMNKRHWYTVCLDGSVPMEEIYRRIDDSYDLAVK